MEQLFISLLNASITAGYLVLAIMLLRPILKKAPKFIRCILWAFVGIRLIFPIPLESITSVIPNAEPIPQEIVTTPQPMIQSGFAMLNSTVNPVLSEAMAPNPEIAVTPMQVFMGIAWKVWLAGVILMALYSIISFFLLRRRLREAVRAEKNIWLCDRVSSPFLLGLFRPRIYLPSDLNPDDKAYVLAHEAAHIRRKDHWWKPLGFLLLTVYWFNPLMWVAYVFLCRDIELACDEKVIKALGEFEKKAYSEALINCSVPRKMISACPIAFGENSVKGRIKSVLHYKKPAFWVIIIAVIVCIAVAVCFLTNPPEDKSDTPQEYRFRATVVEIREDSLLVEPLENAEYFSGAKQVVVNLNGFKPEDYRLGCTVDIIYDGMVQELYPPIIPNASSIVNLSAFVSAIPQPDYTFEAVITEIHSDYMIVLYQTFPKHNLEFQYYQVNYNPTGFSVGDTVEITYDGTGTEAEPYRILGRIYSVSTLSQGSIISQTVTEKYPHFLGLPTDKGLAVYVWRDDGWRCGVCSGTNRNLDSSDLSIFGKGATLEEMAVILSTYHIPREQVSIQYIAYAYSSKPPQPSLNAYEKAQIEQILFTYIPNAVTSESYMPPEFDVRKTYPVVIYGYLLAENSWRFCFYENSTIPGSMQSAMYGSSSLDAESARKKLSSYQLSPDEIPVIVISSYISSYLYEITKKATEDARQVLGLTKGT